MSSEQTELALTLYRHPAIVKLVLERARIPKDAERVAISLEDAHAGPFIVVTRGAAFVTCLGKGMSRGELPLVTREQLDGSMTHWRTLRHSVDVVESYQAKRGVPMLDLMTRIFDAGDTLTREEFRTLAALTPLVDTVLIRAFATQAVKAHETETLLRGQSSRKVNRPLAMQRFKWLYGAAHSALLMASASRDIFEELYGEGKPPLPPPTIMLGLSSTHDVVMRGLWASARIGKVLLPHFKARFLSDDRVVALEAGLGLVALATRHSSLRAEVQKTLTAQRENLQRQKFGEGIAQLLEERESIRTAVLQQGREIYAAITAHLSPQSPYRHATANDVPDGVARTMLLTCAIPVFDASGTVSPLLLEVPLLFDDVQAEDFYWPEDAPHVLLPALTEERAWQAFEAVRGTHDKPEPVTRATRTGRNDPCPCGSGKKHKRCCG